MHFGESVQNDINKYTKPSGGTTEQQKKMYERAVSRARERERVQVREV